VILLTVFAGILMLRYAEPVVVPIVFCVLIKYAFDPVVTRLARWRVPRPLGAAVVLVAVLGTAGTLAYQLRFQAQAILEELPQAARRVRTMVERQRSPAPGAVEQMQKAAAELERAAEAAAPSPKPNGVTRVQITQPSFDVSRYVWLGTTGIAAAVAQLMLILFLSYILLASGDLYRRKVVRIAGSTLTEKRVTVQVLDEIDRQIGHFLLVQLCTSVIVGVATWLALRWIGLDSAGMWGALAGMFNTIPYFGPVLVTGTTAMIAFLQFGTLQQTLITAGAAFSITALEGMVLTPVLMSRAARMNAGAVFVGLLFWGWIWSVWGVLLAVPMLMVIKSICDNIEDFKGVGELLGE
jgi:predicted PurR-regulated permease PerM